MLKLAHSLIGHRNPVYCLSPFDQDLFFSAGSDKGIVMWSLAAQAFKKVVIPVASSVYDMKVWQNLLYYVERNGFFTCYDLSAQQIKFRVKAHAKPAFALLLLPEQGRLITSGEDGTFALWTADNGIEIQRIEVSNVNIRSMALSPDGKDLALACKDKNIYLYNTSDFSCKQVLSGHRFGVTALAYHPEGKYLISGSRDASLKIWSLPHYEEIHQYNAHLYAIYDIKFHPQLKLFASSSQDKSIKIWDAEDFRLYKILSIEKNGEGHSHSVNSLFWSKDGQYLVSSSDDRKVLLWQMEKQ